MEEDEQNCLIVSNFPHSTQKMCCFGVYKLLSDIYKWHLAPKIVILRTFYRKLPLTIFDQPKILTSHWPVIDRSSQNSKFRSLIMWLASRGSSRNCGQWTKSRSTIGYTAAWSAKPLSSEGILTSMRGGWGTSFPTNRWRSTSSTAKREARCINSGWSPSRRTTALARSCV